MSPVRAAVPAVTRYRRVAAVATVMVAVAAGALSWLGWGLRDRHPRYELDVELEPRRGTSTMLRVGFARERITPDLSRPDQPVFLAGFAHNRRATRVHDDLWAIATVIDDGAHRVGLVALDAIGLFHDDVITIRTRAQAPNEIDYLVVASTHNHSTPDLLGLWGPSATRTGVDDTYRRLVIDAAAQALSRATATLEPARVSARQIPLAPDGLVADSRPPYVFDSDLRVLQFTRPDTGATIGSIVGWADHPETPWEHSTEITADFPGYLRDALERGLDPNSGLPGLAGIHLYLNGAIGGLMTTNPETVVTDPVSGQTYKEPSHDKARALGRRLAAEVLHDVAARPLDGTSDASLTVSARTFDIPLDNTRFMLASALRVIARGQPTWRRIRTEVALLRLGDASLLCVPGEVYPEIIDGGITHPDGADFETPPVEVPPLRSIVPGRVTFVVGLANDEIGYIIPKSQWDAQAPWSVPPSGPYGEVVSAGPETGPAVHRAVRDLLSPRRRVR